MMLNLLPALDGLNNPRISYSLHDAKVSSEFASADVNAAEGFLETLDKLIVEGNYLEAQIFNINETSLFWKQIPERTFICKETKLKPGFKAFKDRIAVAWGNVAGYKLTPFVIWHRENPRAFWPVSKCTLPVCCNSNKKSWMTHVLFQDALRNCSASEMENNIHFKNIFFYC